MKNRIRRLPAPIACLLAAALIAGCGGDDSSSIDGPSVDANSDPQTVLDTALGSEGEAIESGVLELTAEIQAGAGTSGSATVSGPFQSNGNEELPSIDFAVKASAQTGDAPLSFDGGLTVTPDGLYVGYGGDEYQLAQEDFDLLKQSYQQSAQAQQDQQDGGSLSQFGIDPSNWLTNVSNDGTEDVDGTETVHISGDADVDRIVSDLGKVAQASGQVDPAGLSQLRDSVKAASIDVYADASNSSLRKLDVSLEITDPSSGGTDTLSFSIGIADPNEGQDIAAPEDAKPLADLIGQTPGIAESLGGGVAPTTPTAPSGTGSTGTGAPSASPAATEKFYNCVANAKTAADVDDCQKLLG